MNPKLKAYLQQLNFILGRNPRLETRKDWQKFIPEPYKAVCLLSADFELAWAWRYTKSSSDPLGKSLAKARLERENMPEILALCEKYNIPVTWLTVGHMFLEKCSREAGIPHAGLQRLPNFENDWWKFSGKDWFEYDPCTDYKTDPLWYCPDLIQQIQESKVPHEIGCHTFSHIDCRDEVCSPELFTAEINACMEAARPFGITKMESFVHPGHTIGNLDTLANMGFTSFRTDYANILGYPKKHETGMWEFSTTLEFDFNPSWSNKAQANRFISLFRRAMKRHSVAYIWFHPSFDKQITSEIMPPVFDFLNKNRKDIWITTIGEYVRFLNS